LAPRQYEKYIHETFYAKNKSNGAVHKAFVPFAVQLPASSESYKNEDTAASEASTRAMWKATYSKEDFFPTNKMVSESNRTHNDQSPSSSLILLGFDIAASCRSQSKFLCQVSGPQYNSNLAFLEQAVVDYGRFLQLKNQSNDPATILVPTLPIDLMWHTHNLADDNSRSHAAYKRDCLTILGQPFHHEDSLSHGKLQAYFEETARLWKSKHGIYYVGGNRGEPLAEYYHHDWIRNKNRKNANGPRMKALVTALFIVVTLSLGPLAWSSMPLLKSRFAVNSILLWNGNSHGSTKDILLTTVTTPEQATVDSCSIHIEQRSLSDVFDTNNNETDAPSVPPSQLNASTTDAPTVAPSTQPLKWVCGGGHQEPSVSFSDNEKNITIHPKCLLIEPSFLSGGCDDYERPLWLSTNAEEQPPMWCYETSDGSNTDTFYLYHSPDCGSNFGPSWQRNDRKSLYKNENDDSTAVPPLEGSWLRWSFEISSWKQGMNVLMTVCDPT